MQTGKCSRLQIEIRADRNLSRSKSVQIGKGADRKKSISKPYCPRFELKPIFYTYEITQKLVLLRISFQNGGYHSEFTKTRKYFFITSKYFALDTSVPVDAVLYEL